MQGACRTFLAGLGATLLGLSVGGDAMAQPQERTAHASLRVRCAGDAVDAEVFIGGQFKGECPVDILLQEGSHELVVVKKLSDTEERRFARTVRLGGNTVRSIDVELEPARLTPRGMELKAEQERQEQERARADAARREQEMRDQAQRKREEQEAAYAQYVRDAQALRTTSNAAADKWLTWLAQGRSAWTPLCPECLPPIAKKRLPEGVILYAPSASGPMAAWQARVLELARAHEADPEGFFRMPTQAVASVCPGSERMLRRVAGMALPEDFSVEEWVDAKFTSPITWRDIRFIPVTMECTAQGLHGSVAFWAYGVEMRTSSTDVAHRFVQATFDNGRLTSPVEWRSRNSGVSHKNIATGELVRSEFVRLGLYEQPWLPFNSRFMNQGAGVDWSVLHAEMGSIFKTPEILWVSLSSAVRTENGPLSRARFKREDGRWVSVR